MDGKIKLEISAWAILKVILILAAFYLLYLIRDVAVLLFLVLILVAAFRPIVNKWEKNVTRGGAVAILTLITIIVIAFIFYIIFPPLLSQIKQLINFAPEYVDKFKVLAPYKTEIDSVFKSISSHSGEITTGVYTATVNAFSAIASLLLALVMTIYLLLDRNGLKDFIINLVPKESQNSIIGIAKKMSNKVGGWLRGQLTLCLSIAIVDFIGLTIIGIPYALTLGVLAGISEFVPILGPLFSGIITCLVALSISPIKAIIVAILYILVQQLENTILVPKIMGKAIGISPVIIILAILIGSRLLGLFGALLAVPIAALLFVIISEWQNIKQLIKNETI